MEPKAKKPKTDELCSSDSNTVTSARDGHLPFHEFETEKTILVNPQSKLIAVVGKFLENTENRGVLVAEKQPLTESSLKSMLSPDSKVTKNFQNDIYSQYVLDCPGGVGEVKVTSVYPATEAHVKKYSEQELVMVRESPSDYQNITKPFIVNHPLGIDWVYNILEGRSETERVVYSDGDPETGFVLLPDLKWDQKEVENLYMLAVVRKRGLLSLRELNDTHLPLLKNVLYKGKEVIRDKYGLREEELRCYVHYQPSYYHLHMHFTHLRYNAPRTCIGQAHLLDDVIDNIELDSHYYAKRTISFVMKRDSPLSQHFSKTVTNQT